MNRLVRTQFLILLGAAVALLWRPTSVTAQTALLEVDKGEVKLMQVNDDGGLVVGGRLDDGFIPASGGGTRLMWHPRKGAFRVGLTSGAQWDEANIGGTSVAMGQSTTASGEISTAMGNQTTASGDLSTATGTQTTASGIRSTAMGASTTAFGLNSTAIGSLTTASGNFSTAMGDNTKAIGDYSTAIGSYAAAFGRGSFAYGDRSTTALITALIDEFVVRASGGFRFRTNSSLSTGCDLPAGSGTFNCTSSRLAKEDFEDLDGETVLGKLATMRIQRWRYLGTRASHVGPTAEDFHAAFELGGGPTTISTVDADGISLLAVQALERRTAELRKENADLRRRLEALEAERAAERK